MHTVRYFGQFSCGQGKVYFTHVSQGYFIDIGQAYNCIIPSDATLNNVDKWNA